MAKHRITQTVILDNTGNPVFCCQRSWWNLNSVTTRYRELFVENHYRWLQKCSPNTRVSPVDKLLVTRNRSLDVVSLDRPTQNLNLTFLLCVNRDIERRKSQDEQERAPWLSEVDNYRQWLMLCLFVVLLSCVICVRCKWRTASALHRVPTMSYYMIDAESSPSSVHVHKCRSYSQLSHSLYSS